MEKCIITICVLEYDDQYMEMDASGVPRNQEARVSNSIQYEFVVS